MNYFVFFKICLLNSWSCFSSYNGEILLFIYLIYLHEGFNPPTLKFVRITFLLSCAKISDWNKFSLTDILTLRSNQKEFKKCSNLFSNYYSWNKCALKIGYRISHIKFSLFFLLIINASKMLVYQVVIFKGLLNFIGFLF